MNLPDIYARVIAAKPELVVPGLKHHALNGWTFENETNANYFAEALILKRWLEAMPPLSAIGTRPSDHKWNCFDGTFTKEGVGYTVILALAEFHVPGSTEGER